MARPPTSAKLPRTGKRGRPRIYDRDIARTPGTPTTQREYADLIKQIEDTEARKILALFDEEIPDWRNGQWAAKLKLLQREIRKRRLALHPTGRAIEP